MTSKTTRLEGVQTAIRNNYNYSVTTHLHQFSYKKNCLMCGENVYYDGSIYWSLCLRHLEETQVGPFRPRDLDDGSNYD